jgi:hypothetical protein
VSIVEEAVVRLQRLERGRDAFRTLIARWMAASGWSYATISELAEQAVTDVEAVGIPSFAGTERKGEVFSCNGHVWRAKVDLDGHFAPIYSNARNSTESWDKNVFEHVAALRRLFPSQVNNLLRGLTQSCYPATFDCLGTLNEWLDAVKRGTRALPADERLAQAATDGVVVQDDQGLFGPEEFLACYLGLIDLPDQFGSLSEAEANQISTQLGQLIRQSMAAVGLDLVGDWGHFLALYPTSDKSRRRRVQEVALGLRKWPGDDVRNEEAAVRIACKRLLIAHSKDPLILKLEGVQVPADLVSSSA